jgi:methylenetetrahydrofolate reductase (NADPH)
MSLKSALESGKFVVTAEVAPPKGTNVEELNDVAERLKGWIDGANVTDQQSAVMRLGSLAACYILRQQGLDPVFQLTCRDRNRIALQSDLLSAYVMGIRNVLAITGDLPELGDHPEAEPVYDLDSVQLLEAISRLNEGFDLTGNELQGRTEFFSGAVVNPCANTEAAYELQIIKLQKKIKAGAKFIQTQGVFDASRFADFVKRVQTFNVPILAGIIPLKSASMANYMNKNVPGVQVPELLINRMAQAENKNREGVEIAAELIMEIKDICQGVHIMAIGWERKIPSIIEAAKL